MGVRERVMEGQEKEGGQGQSRVQSGWPVAHWGDARQAARC